jgi:hypothetical protein
MTLEHAMGTRVKVQAIKGILAEYISWLVDLIALVLLD